MGNENHDAQGKFSSGGNAAGLTAFANKHAGADKPPAPAKGKLSIKEILATGTTLALKPAPYSEKSFTDGNFLNLQPYRGSWVVTHQGELLGSIRRSKDGTWNKSQAMFNSGPKGAKIDEAAKHLDEYYAAGGK